MEENIIERLVQKIAQEQLHSIRKTMEANATDAKSPALEIGLDDYPLASKRPELVKGFTGKTLNEITLRSVMDNKVLPEDIRISSEVLELQAMIAESNAKKQLAQNLRRAAELTKIPDEKVLQIYELLRPKRATKKQLLETASEIEEKYGAALTAKLIREAALVYESRGIVNKD